MPDRLTELFAHLAEEVGGQARPRPASAVRARGELRTKRLAATGFVVAGLVVATVGAMVGLSPADAGQHRSSYPGAAGTARPPLLMPHEGDPGWVRSDDPRAPGAFNPCSTVDVTLTGRTAAFTMTGHTVPDSESRAQANYVDQLLVYATVEAAHAVVGQLEAAMHHCGWAGGFTPETEFGRIGFNGYYPSERLGGGVTDTRDVMVTTRQNAVIIIYDRMVGSVIQPPETWPLYMMAFNACDSLGICEAPTCPTALPVIATDGPQTCPGAESLAPAQPGSGAGATPGPTGSDPPVTGTPDVSGTTVLSPR